MRSDLLIRLAVSPQQKRATLLLFTALTLLAIVPTRTFNGDRAVAALATLVASSLAGALWQYRGIVIAIASAIVLVIVRPFEDPSPLLVLSYPLITAGAASLSALVVSTVRTSLATTQILAEQLKETERNQLVVESISHVGRALASGFGNESNVDAALRTLTDSLDLDVVIIRRNMNLDRRFVSAIHHWVTHPDGDPHLDRNDGLLSWSDLPNMRGALASGQPFAFSSLDDVPEPDRSTLTSGIARLESVLNLPVTADGEWLGHAAFARRSDARPWASRDVAYLEILTDMFAGAWMRERHTSDLVASVDERERAIRAERALTEGTQILLADSDRDPLSTTLSLVMTALACDLSYIEWFDEDPELGTVSRPITHLCQPPLELEQSITWPLSSMPEVGRRLLAGQPFIFGSPAEERTLDPDRIEVYDTPLAAECNIPIVVDGKSAGMVGIGSFEPHPWSESEIGVMKSFALMLGAYFERAAAMRHLEDLVSAKDRFIASVSHELRTPLAVVVGLASEMQDNDLAFTPEERAEFVGMIRRQSNEVSNIIDDLLVSTRINETELTVIESDFALDDLARDVIRDLQTEVTAKVRLLDLDPVRVLADPLRTRQIVRNLITNAHRYGGDDISITVRRIGDRGVLEVGDNGPGVPEERRDDIFEAYHTTGGGPTVTAAIGLGLTVSRQLARLMEGDVTYIHGDVPRFVLELREASASSE